MEQLNERIAKAPLGIKIAVVLITLAVVTALNFLVIGVPPGKSINEIESRIKKTDVELDKTKKDYITKQAIANDLNRFRREKEILEQRFNEAKAVLPDQSQIDDLLAAFQDNAQKSGLEITSVEPKAIAANAAGFYSSIPIAMSVVGSYHEIATFFDALGRMRRIVNVSEVSLDQPKDVNGKIILNGKFLVTAFMFVEAKKAAGPGTTPGGGVQ